MKISKNLIIWVLVALLCLSLAYIFGIKNYPENQCNVSVCEVTTEEYCYWVEYASIQEGLILAQDKIVLDYYPDKKPFVKFDFLEKERGRCGAKD